MDLAEAVRLDPQNAVAYEARGTTYEHLGDHNKALSDFTEALRLDPKNVLACNGLAWVLATRPTSVASNGVTAVGYALKACELLNWEVPGCLPTLAAAYAQSGDFTKAIQWEKKYLETQNLDPKAATRARQRLALYEAHKPYHVEK